MSLSPLSLTDPDDWSYSVNAVQQSPLVRTTMMGASMANNSLSIAMYTGTSEQLS